MIPATVKFTDLDLEPITALEPRKKFQGTYPVEWIRHQWSLSFDVAGDLKMLDRWLEANMLGRWGSYRAYGTDTVKFVVLFEQVTDAVMFRLKGGERAFLERDE